jgi:asparagine synthase (glutamine-hydrolysing)
MEGALAGVEVALDGIDGDGVVAGNWTYLSDLAVTGRWSRLRRETRALATVHGVHPNVAHARFVRDPLIPAPVRRAIASARHRTNTDFQPRFRAKATRATTAGPWRPGASFAANERLLLHPGVAPAVLEAIDEAWLQRGIEPAHPFMDRRVIEYCMGLPREQKVRAGYTKVVLRNAMRGVLPTEVTDRAAKAEMGSSFIAGLLGTGWGPLSQGLSLAPSNLSHWLGPNAFARMAQADGPSLEPYRTAFLAIWRAWADGTIAAQPQGNDRLSGTGR